ncbi:MAG: T9SS type A sorting domain-containing protein [Bacteroidetes bacterium]|uniref:T9SS type A sorting domain-containing protein n=1 Tax=Candidatus Enterocola intestinipullorum TaxID=2840783 RepID=A0A9D9EJA6_9BACT|nr:T9SS type A sorting domain-containing protein [Candidatus Enterocola intestinipullorum]
MSKRYSLFKGAGAASIRRLGVLLAMLLSTAWYSVSYADAGFQDTNTMDLKINTDAKGAYWLYYPENNADSKRFETGNGIWQETYEEPVDLGDVTAFTIVRPAVTMWANDNTAINSVSFRYQLRDQSNNIVGGSSRDWNMNSNHVTYAQDGTIEYAANINIDVITTFNLSSSPGQYTLEFWLKASTSAGDKFLNNQDQNYKITFTIPQQGPVFNPSETTMYFGNVPYGKDTVSTVHFEYNGSTPLSGNTETEAGISFGSRGAFFEFVDIGNNGTDGWITYRFRPDETNSNKSFTNETHRISLTKDDEPLTVIFNASSFTPLIAGSREPVRAQSIAELSGAIMYTGCNTIEEYGVYYSTDPGFFDSATNTVDMSKSQVANVTGVKFGDPVDNLKVTVDGLMSGTTYYYIWYMKDSAGQTTFDAVLNFTTNEGDYRLAVNDAVAGTETYYGFIYEGEAIDGSNDNITNGYVQYWLSCTPSQTYRLQFNYMHEDRTYEWIDVPSQSGTIPSTFSQSYVRIYGTDLVKNNSAYANARLSVPEQREVPAADYTYNVYFTKADGSAVTGKDRSDLVMTVTGAESDTIKGGLSGTFAQFPEGSQYRVERVYKNQPDVACEIGSGAVPEDFTGPVSTDVVLNVTYTGGDLAPEFSISRDLWVYTNDNATGTTQTPENTMAGVACTNGEQGQAADYSLIWQLSSPENTIDVGNYQIRTGNSSEPLQSWNTQWSYNNGNKDGYVCYWYDSNSNMTYMDVIAREGDVAKLRLTFLSADGAQVASYDMVKVEGSNHVYTYDLSDQTLPENAVNVTVYGMQVYNNNAYGAIHAATIPVSGITGGEFTYDLAANCLTVEISGLQFAGEAGQEIQIGEDNKVTLCVENINESGSVLADQYSVVLTDNKTGRPMPFDGQTEDIAAGGQVCLTTVDPLENLNNYNLKAELLFGGALVDEASLENCLRPEGDTIYYTIDNTLTYDDACALQFCTIGAAMADLKTDENYYDAGSKNLLKHIVFKIVGGNGDYVGETDNDVSGGDVNTKVNMISDINNGDEPADGYKVFIMRNADYENPQVGKPVVNHVVIRNSRNVQLLFLDIQGYTKNTTSYDNAIDIDNGSKSWLATPKAGDYANGRIQIRFCDISSMGFTCVHLSAYDDVLFEENRITANIDPDYTNPNNQRDWGSSVKFIRCSNVKFLRNTFRGQHITNIWLQECENVLVMNNVFWTENEQAIDAGGNSVAMIRLMSQDNVGSGNVPLPVNNIGIYYNTFYISATNVPERADFLKFGGDVSSQNGRASSYSLIDFNYNNCYSMDPDQLSRSGNPLWDGQGTTNVDVRYNNFWTVAEGDLSEQGMRSSLSIYAIPEGTGEKEDDVVYNINVPAQMCSTANDNPDGLVVRGTGLNLGKTIEGDISGQGAEELNNDRLYPAVGEKDGVRPYKAQKGWTLGAYQQSDARQPLGTIYWFGGSDDITGQAWDLRSNWRCYDMQTRALRQVDCLDTFSDTLLVIVPAPNSTRFPVPEGGVKSYPRIPTAFDNAGGERDTISNNAYTLDEYVQAGLGMKNYESVMADKPWYFKTIYIEYGGSLLFANYLYNKETGKRHYDGASASYLGPRNVWGLTGAMIQPFVDYNSADRTHSDDVRMVKSSDYYLNLEPQVYMRYADVVQSEGQVKWTRSFPDMDVEIEPGMQFAIYLSQLYGLFGMSDNEYAEWTGKTQFIDHANTPITYNLYGRFAAEAALPYYKNLAPGEYNLLNNYLPANLSVKEILKAPDVEEVKYYVAGTNGMMGSFVDISDATVQQGDSLIYPKNGFLVKGKDLTELRITDNMVSNSHAQIYNLRNMAETYPYVSVVANNDDTPYGSQISVEVNPNVNSYNFEEFAKDKLFQGTPEMSYVPDVYIMMGEGYDEVVSVPDAETVIPLGVRVREKMDLSFYVRYIDGINEVWLEDRATAAFYDVANYKGTIRGLEPADYQGRFYLHLSSNSEEEDPDEEENPDIDVPTDVEETTAASGIDIFNTAEVITVSSTSDIALSAVYVTDMAGRTRSYKASGNYVRIVTDLVPGVYVVNAVGDKESTERKIVVK